MPKDGLPDAVVEWIREKTKERERDGKKTEFQYEKRMVPIDRIQETTTRAKFQNIILPYDTPTPMGLTYSTPAGYDMVPSPFNANTISPRRSDKPRSNPVPDIQPVQPLNFRLTWKGYNRADSENMIADAKALSDLGKLEEAEHKFQEALSGFENLLSATNERTVSVAYELAEFYAKNFRMSDADEILEWVSENTIKSWGLEHSKTITHMLHAMDLYYAWSRPNDALTLLLRAVEYLEDPPVIKKTRFQEVDDDVLPKRPTVITRMINTSKSAGHGDKPSYLEFGLVVASAQARASDEEAEPLLLALIKQCERLPEQFAIQNFKAHGSLLDLYYKLEKLDKLQPALNNAKECFFATMENVDGEKKTAVSLLNAAVDLAGHFVQVGKLKIAEAMFDLLEQAVTEPLDVDGADNAIDLLVAIGTVYQTHGKWKYARPRFEHALAITLASRGPESMMRRRLQATLGKRSFPMASLPSSDFNTWHRRDMRP